MFRVSFRKVAVRYFSIKHFSSWGWLLSARKLHNNSITGKLSIGASPRTPSGDTRRPSSGRFRGSRESLNDSVNYDDDEKSSGGIKTKIFHVLGFNSWILTCRLFWDKAQFVFLRLKKVPGWKDRRNVIFDADFPTQFLCNARNERAFIDFFRRTAPSWVENGFQWFHLFSAFRQFYSNNY